MMTGHSKPLSTYFSEVFAPDALQNVASGTRDAYRKAVRKFVGWSGCDIPIHAVTEGLLERFSRQMIIDGMSTQNVRAYTVYLRRIVRHRYPDVALKACGRRPGENNPVTIAGLAEQDLDIEGSLYRFWRESYVPRRMIGARPASVDIYRYSLTRFARFLGRPPMMTDLNDDTVSAFLSWILNIAQLSVPTANSSRAHLLTLWRYAVKRGILQTLPTDVEKLKEPRRLPEAWTMDELAQIITAARQQQTPKTGMPYPPGLFFPAMILAAYDTGLRLRGLLGIRLNDWNPERRELVADADTMKNAVSQRFVVSEETSDAIHAMLAAAKCHDEQQNLLFPWPLRRDSIIVTFRGILKRAGLYRSRKDGWHKLRRTSATHLTAAVGIETACRQLGHSSTAMTSRYVDPRLTADHDAAAYLPRPQRR